MRDLIDLHCHILPGVDDGPATLEHSLALAHILLENGFSEVVATPHYIDDFSTEYSTHIQKQHELLTQALLQAQLPLTVHLGAEILLQPKIEAMAKEKRLPTINGTNYILFELPLFQPLPSYLRHTLFILQTQGYRTILAHPERVEALKDNMEEIYNLTKLGLLLQINVGSLTGIYGKRAQRTVGRIIASGMAHFAATDSHDTGILYRQPLQSLNEETINHLLKIHPAMVLSGETLQCKPVQPTQNLQERIRRFFSIS
jgi:protein-tyrosine phosphatase